MSLRILSAIVLTGVVLAGCIGDGEESSPVAGRGGSRITTPTDRELLARISAVLRERPSWYLDTLAYLDLHRARDQLGLPPAASILGPGKRRLLLSLTTRPLFRFSTTIGGNPSLGALGDVLDDRHIETAVGTNFAFSGPGSDEIWPWDALVLRTSQPFREVATLLRREGYWAASGGLLLADRPPPRNDIDPRSPHVPFPAVGRAGEDVVVFGGSAQAVRTAQGGSQAQLTGTATLLAQLSGVARVVSGPIAGGSSGRCVMAVGLGEDAAPRAGQMVVSVKGTAEERRFELNGLTLAAMSEGAEVVFGQAAVAGNQVSVRFRSTDRLYPTRLAVEDVAVPYECP